MRQSFESEPHQDSRLCFQIGQLSIIIKSLFILLLLLILLRLSPVPQ